jgi:hypothetical protein
MKNLGYKIAVATALALATGFVASVNVRAQNDDRPHRFSAKLSTFNEVPPQGHGRYGNFPGQAQRRRNDPELDLHMVGIDRPTPFCAHSLWPARR